MSARHLLAAPLVVALGLTACGPGAPSSGVELTLSADREAALREWMAGIADDWADRVGEHDSTLRVLDGPVLELCRPTQEELALLQRYPLLQRLETDGGCLRFGPLEEVTREDLRRGLASAAAVIRRRIEQELLSAEVIAESEDRLLLRLSDEAATSRSLLTRRCYLELRDVIHAAADPGALQTPFPDGLPPGAEPAGREHRGEWLLLASRPILDGTLLEDARLESDGDGNPIVGISWNDAGAGIFRDATAQRIDERIAVLIDGTVQVAPVIRTRIGRHAVIEGGFSFPEARELALCLRSPLPVALRVDSERRFDARTPAPAAASQRDLAPSRERARSGE